jgi:hypothetical protein
MGGERVSRSTRPVGQAREEEPLDVHRGMNATTVSLTACLSKKKPSGAGWEETPEG